MNTIDIIGYLAALLTTVSFIPQVYKIIKTKSAKDISLGMYSVFMVGILLWLIYGFTIGSMPVTIANFITLLLVLVILFLKIKLK